MKFSAASLTVLELAEMADIFNKSKGVSNMEKTRLITASLINSVDWLEKCPPTWTTRAYNSLKDTLSGIWNDPTVEIKRGMDFEARINKLLSDRELPIEGNVGVPFYSQTESEVIQKFLEFIPKGMQQQKVAKKYIDLDGHKYCIYCKLDLYKPGDVKDIKTTQSYKPGKYLETFQHILYLYATDEKQFDYLVATFDKETQSVKGFEMESFKSIEEEDLGQVVIDRIRALEKTWIRYPELGNLYNTKFCKY